jgi:two-component system cell cycle sensor histidine kinase/response regulator CckA
MPSSGQSSPPDASHQKVGQPAASAGGVIGSVHAARFLDSIIEHLPAMIFVKDAEDLRFARFNRAGEQLLGLARDQLIGKNDYDFFPPDQADAFTQKDREVLASRALHDIPQEPINTPHGTRWLHTLKIPILDDAGEPRFLLGVSMDISEQKRAEELLRSTNEELELRVRERTAELNKQLEDLRRAEDALARTEEQLRQSQKMEAIGRLAGGIAHDFNNLLSVVLGYAEMLLQQMPEEDKGRAYVEEIERAGSRASELTHQLLAFGRRQVLKPTHIDLNAVVFRIERMLSRLLGEDIELTLQPGLNLGTVKADPSQVEQVLMNLIVNARDAMPRGGVLTLKTDNCQLDQSFAAAHLGAAPGDFVRLTVQDTGIGMDKATQAQIFEPFFTTKEPGRGTGLGLSTVFGIVRQSGGFISVTSSPGCGASFEVYLPRVAGAPAEVPRQLAAPQSVRGSETILLVEDEEQVRTFAAKCLRQLGYQVIEADGPAQALRSAEAHAAVIHLLLTDVIMPERAGGELATELLQQRPQLRVLFMSGYTDDAVARHGVPSSAVAFMQKPLTPNLLARRVRETLDAETLTGS